MTYVIIVVQSQQVLRLVARNIIQLHILIHAEGDDEANATVNCLVGLRVHVDVAPFEISDGGVSRVIDAYNRQFGFGRPNQHLGIILSTARQQVALMIPLDVFDDVLVTSPYLQRRVRLLNAPEVDLRLAGSSQLRVVLPGYIKNSPWLPK